MPGKKTQKAVRKALASYVRNVGGWMHKEPVESQASDLITDLLLMFDEATAELILDRVRRDFNMEHQAATPVFASAF